MSDEQHIITDPDGNEFEIPVEGSIGLLALGDIGYLAWKAKIEEVKRGMAARSAAAGLDPTGEDPAEPGTEPTEESDDG